MALAFSALRWACAGLMLFSLGMSGAGDREVLGALNVHLQLAF
jgi:hypothetical protein